MDALHQQNFYFAHICSSQTTSLSLHLILVIVLLFKYVPCIAGTVISVFIFFEVEWRIAEKKRIYYDKIKWTNIPNANYNNQSIFKFLKKTRRFISKLPLNQTEFHIKPNEPHSHIEFEEKKNNKIHFFLHFSLFSIFFLLFFALLILFVDYCELCCCCCCCCILP